MDVDYQTFVDFDPELMLGAAGRFKFGIKALDIQDQYLDLPHPSVTVVVGGNNVGKSTLLRQIWGEVGRASSDSLEGPYLLKDINYDCQGGADDVLRWLFENRPNASQGSSRGFTSASNEFVHRDLVKGYWTSRVSTESFGSLGRLLVRYLNVEERLALSRPTSRREQFDQPAIHPLHACEDDPSLMGYLSAVGERAFGEALTLDPISGSLMIRVGKAVIPAARGCHNTRISRRVIQGACSA